MIIRHSATGNRSTARAPHRNSASVACRFGVMCLVVLLTQPAFAAFKVKPEPADTGCMPTLGKACTTRDITTPVRDTRICTGFPPIGPWHSNWAFRLNRYYYSPKTRQVTERTGDLSSSNDCKMYKKYKTLVDDRYALTVGFPLITFSGDLCSDSLTLDVHRNPFDDRLRDIRLFRERHGYSEQSTNHLKRSFGDDVHIAYGPEALFYIGYYQISGLMNDPIRRALRGTIEVIRSECGQVPPDIGIEGFVSKPKRKTGRNRYSGDPDFEQIYSGVYREDVGLVHTDQEKAETYLAWAEAKRKAQENATFQAVLEKEAAIQKARKGTAVVFFALYGTYMTSPCNIKELCEIYKPQDCVAPPC